MIFAPASGWLAAVLLTERHQAGHLMLGQADFLAPELGERKIGDLECRAAILHREFSDVDRSFLAVGVGSSATVVTVESSLMRDSERYLKLRRSVRAERDFRLRPRRALSVAPSARDAPRQ
jgi:hypothetical protein